MIVKNTETVGIVIVTYNSEQVIEECLLSVLKQRKIKFKCIVVDNNSTDKTLDIVQKNFPIIPVIRNKENIGFGAAVNSGMRELLRFPEVKYILLLNPDTVSSPLLLTKLKERMEKDPLIGVISPLITYTKTPQTIWFAGGYINKLFCYTKHSNMNKKIVDIPTTYNLQLTTDFISGACMMIRASVLKHTGLFPEEYFLYWEDVEFSRKIHEANYKLYILPKLLIQHTVSTSTGEAGSNELSPLRAYYYARNPFLYIKRNVHGLLKINNYLGQFFIRFPYYALKMLLQGNLKSIIAYMRGIKDGITYKSETRISKYETNPKSKWQKILNYLNI